MVSGGLYCTALQLKRRGDAATGIQLDNDPSAPSVRTYDQVYEERTFNEGPSASPIVYQDLDVSKMEGEHVYALARN